MTQPLAGNVAPAFAGAEITFRTVRSERPELWLASSRYPRFAAKGETYRVANSAFRRVALSHYNTWLRGAREFFADGRPHPLHGLWKYETTPTLSIARDDLVSGFYDVFDYSGAVHETTYYYGVTVGRAQGRVRELTLRDLFRTDVDVRKTVSNRAMARLRRLEGAEWVQNGSVKQIDPAVHSWYLTPSALVLLFQPYSIGSYATGAREVKLPFSDFGDTLDPNGPLKNRLTRQARRGRTSR